jgi:hypothetical protein
MRLLALLATLFLAGCLQLGLEKYVGAYTVSCPGLSAEDVRADLERIANQISAQVGSPLTNGHEPPGYLSIFIERRPDPAISFYFGLTEPDSYGIYVEISNPLSEEDSATRNVRAVIETALKDSRCASWKYKINYSAFTDGRQANDSDLLALAR